MLVVLLLVAPGLLNSAAHASGSMICGQVKNGSSTGAFFPTLIVSGTGEVLPMTHIVIQAPPKLDVFEHPNPPGYMDADGSFVVGYFQIYDPVISNGTLDDFSQAVQVDSCEPPTELPPTELPPIWTPIPPTWTAIPPTPEIISTVIIPPAITAVQNQLVGLQVQPINQLIRAGSRMSNGNIDYGWENCAVASTAMVLQYLQSQGVLDSSDTTDYLAVRDVLRSQGDNVLPWKGLDNQAIVDFTPQLTHNKLEAHGSWVEPEHFQETVQNELNANRPVIATVPDWSVLPGHSGVAPHSILIYGLQDGNLYYIDPWGGKKPQQIPVDDYTKSAMFNGKLEVITFWPTSAK